MKMIKGFENEDIIVSDFGEWVGKNYIDYKSEYENNQKIIKRLLDESKNQKEVIDKSIDFIVKETKSMPTNGCKIRLIELLDILKEVSE